MTMTTSTKSAAFDPITKPSHYNRHVSGIECKHIAYHLSGAWSHALTYVWRAEYKDGIKDLQKCLRVVEECAGNDWGMGGIGVQWGEKRDEAKLLAMRAFVVDQRCTPLGAMLLHLARNTGLGHFGAWEEVTALRLAREGTLATLLSALRYAITTGDVNAERPSVLALRGGDRYVRDPELERGTPLVRLDGDGDEVGAPFASLSTSFVVDGKQWIEIPRLAGEHPFAAVRVSVADHQVAADAAEGA